MPHSHDKPFAVGMMAAVVLLVAALPRASLAGPEAKPVGVAAGNKGFIVLKGHDADLWWAEFSPNGKSVVTASSDKTARIWDTETGKTLHVLSGHEEAVEARLGP